MINSSDTGAQQDAQALLNQVVLEHLQEQRRKRVWRWIFRAILLIIVLFGFFKLFELGDEDASLKDKPHVGLIDIQGPIFEDVPASADNLSKSLDGAYKSTGLKAIILRINSPGGSPVQADYMFQTIKYYKKKHPEVGVHAVCVDLCASAAYYIAAAADDIYANPASMVGSIGVIYNGFGFDEAMKKLGITRRMQTAGVNKGFLDPFSPETAEQRAFLQNMLNDVHQQFIARVKEGRGKRLKPNQETFSGLIWTGNGAKAQGLIDGFSSTGQLARKLLDKPVIVDYSYKESVLERVTKTMGASVVSELPKALGFKAGMRE